jgi:hypothetical protein
MYLTVVLWQDLDMEHGLFGQKKALLLSSRVSAMDTMPAVMIVIFGIVINI